MAATLDWEAENAGSARDMYRRTLLELGREDARIFCVDSDMGGFEETFGAELPGQYVNVGIAEANLMGVSAGLAAAGLIPFATTMSTFATTRACEQVKLDVAAGNVPVRIVATHAGLSAGHYGPTHHSLEDLAIARAMPNLTVIVPADASETRCAVRAAAYLPGPAFIRLGRAQTPLVHRGPFDFVIGSAIELAAGDDVTVIATGALPVTMAMRAHEQLDRAGVAARILNMHTIAPLDGDAVIRAASQTAGIVTVEDHLAAGGLGGAVCEMVCAAHPCRVTRIGAANAHVDRVGGESDLLEHIGVTVERIVAAVLSLAGRQKGGNRGNGTGHDGLELSRM